MKKSVLLVGFLLVACDQPPAEDEVPPEPPGPPQIEAISPAEHLTRASMALRGIRPDPTDYSAVAADSSALEGLVDQWLDSAEFGETLRDLHAEQLLMRAETLALPRFGPLAGVDSTVLNEALSEAPLRLIEDIVLGGEPYTKLLTADYTMTNATGAEIWGLDYDPDGAEWQRATWMEPRPAAGLLVSNELWMRHISNGQNYQRARANIISKFFLCNDFLTRDVPLDGGIDLSDPAVVAEAVYSEPVCVGCHQSLDPLGALVWPFPDKVRNAVIANLYEDGTCDTADPDSPEVLMNCYPLYYFVPQRADRWESLGLRAPGYFGLPASDLAELGAQIIADPRFAQCTAKRFYGYLSQTAVDGVALEAAAEFQDVFVDSGYDAKALTRAIVLSDRFSAKGYTNDSETYAIAGLQVLRPEHAQRMILDLTGFEWRIKPDPVNCGQPGAAQNCFGNVDLTVNNIFGFRAMTGGIDSVLVTVPTHTMTPVKTMFTAALAAEAAGYVVDRDAEITAVGDRTLFVDIDNLETTDEGAVRDALVALHLRVLGEETSSDSESVTESWTLFASALTNNDDDAAAAWKVVLTALLQDIRVLTY